MILQRMQNKSIGHNAQDLGPGKHRSIVRQSHLLALKNKMATVYTHNAEERYTKEVGDPILML